MVEIPKQPTRTALGNLLDGHRALIREGLEPQAQILAQSLLDRVEVTPNGGGVVQAITSGEAMVIMDRVISATAPDLRGLVQRILITGA